jgi:flavin reductase (DIM6/NTAB) family NADH-FMN oxidoreductase RutF
MPAIFVTPLSITPPLIGVAVHASRHTHDMIKYSEEFALNIPTRELLHHVQYLGSVSGAELNKFELTRLPTFRARRIEAPLLEGCVGWIECGVHDAYVTGDHTLFVGSVVAVSAEKDAFDDTWLLNDPEEKPLHYLGVNYYSTLGARGSAHPPAGRHQARRRSRCRATRR